MTTIKNGFIHLDIKSSANGGASIKYFIDLFSSISFVIGWFIVVVAACYFIPSIFLGGIFLLGSFSGILFGMMLIWVSKQI